MTRARKDGDGPEGFGWWERACVRRGHPVDQAGYWHGLRWGELRGRWFATWREAMDYALGENAAK